MTHVCVNNSFFDYEQSMNVCTVCGKCFDYVYGARYDILNGNYNISRYNYLSSPYKRITHVRQVLKGINYLNPNQKTTIELAFKKIIIMYDSIYPNKNMIQYKYILNKFGYIFNIQILIEKFNLFKTKSRLKLYDPLWKIICDKHNWPFIKSY